MSDNLQPNQFEIGREEMTDNLLEDERGMAERLKLGRSRVIWNKEAKLLLFRLSEARTRIAKLESDSRRLEHLLKLRGDSREDIDKLMEATHD